MLTSTETSKSSFENMNMPVKGGKQVVFVKIDSAYESIRNENIH